MEINVLTASNGMWLVLDAKHIFFCKQLLVILKLPVISVINRYPSAMGIQAIKSIMDALATSIDFKILMTGTINRNTIIMIMIMMMIGMIDALYYNKYNTNKGCF